MAGADFEKGIALVIRVARQQRGLQFKVQALDVGLCLGDFLPRQVGHLGVGQQF